MTAEQAVTIRAVASRSVFKHLSEGMYAVPPPPSCRLRGEAISQSLAGRLSGDVPESVERLT